MSVLALTLISALTHLPCTQFIYQTCVFCLCDVWVLRFPIHKGQCLWGREVGVWLFLLHRWNRLRPWSITENLVSEATCCSCYRSSLPCCFYGTSVWKQPESVRLEILSLFHKLPHRKKKSLKLFIKCQQVDENDEWCIRSEAGSWLLSERGWQQWWKV